MYTQSDLALVDGMNKQRLREACKAATIARYSKMTVDQMREALRHHIGRALVAHAPAQMETAFKPVKRSKAKDVKTTVAQPRESRNGVKRPNPGGVCARVWSWLDEHPGVTVKDVRAWAESEKLNVGNAQIEFYQHRKFYAKAA